MAEGEGVHKDDEDDEGSSRGARFSRSERAGGGDPSSGGEPDGGGEPTSGGERLGTLLAVLLLVAIGVGLVFAAFEIWPDHVHEPADPSWVDNLFASKSVIFGARVVLLSAAVTALMGAVYTATSIVVRMRHAHWLRRVGPFEVSEEAVSSAVAALRDEAEYLQGLLDLTEEELTDLRARLAETEELAEHFYDLWQQQQPDEEDE